MKALSLAAGIIGLLHVAQASLAADLMGCPGAKPPHYDSIFRSLEVRADECIDGSVQMMLQHGAGVRDITAGVVRTCGTAFYRALMQCGATSQQASAYIVTNMINPAIQRHSARPFGQGD
jgi:hypothetical protein